MLIFALIREVRKAYQFVLSERMTHLIWNKIHGDDDLQKNG